MASSDSDSSFAEVVGLNKYRTLTIVTWLMVIVYQTILSSCSLFGSSTFWAINEAHPTMFALNRESVCVYWYALNTLQLVYICLLCFGNEDDVNDAVSIDAHFIAYNILNVLWISFWVFSQFWLGEVCLAINLLHLWSLYLINDFVGILHLSIVVGPLAWTFFGLFMNGAALLDGHTQVSEAVGYVFILAVFFFWISLVLCCKDFALGFCFSFLFISLGIQQSLLGIHEFSIVSAFVVGAMFFFTSAVLAILEALGKEITIRHDDDDAFENAEARQNMESPDSIRFVPSND